MILADLFSRAGAPPGLLNVIHGQHAAVDFICEHPDIKAVSFVGSDQAVRCYRPLLCERSLHRDNVPSM